VNTARYHSTVAFVPFLEQPNSMLLIGNLFLTKNAPNWIVEYQTICFWRKNLKKTPMRISWILKLHYVGLEDKRRPIFISKLFFLHFVFCWVAFIN